MIIAVSGVDGSGKSTLTKNLHKHYLSQGQKVKLFYVGEYILLKYIVKILHILVGKKSSKEKKFHENKKIQSENEKYSKTAKNVENPKIKNSEQTNPFLQKGKKNIFLQFWVLFTIIDNFFVYSKLKYWSTKGYKVICDRYFYDKLIGFQYHGYSNKFFSKIYLALTPKPNIWIVLDVDEQTSQNRETNGKHTIEFYTKIRKNYAKITKKVKSQQINVENKTTEQVLEQAINLLN